MNRIFYLRENPTLILNDNGTYRLTRGNPVAIIMSNVDREEGCINYSIAILNRKDVFSKDLARHIATKRLEICPTVITGAPETGHEIKKKIMEDLSNNSYVRNILIPRRIHKIIDSWLKFAEKPKQNVRTKLKLNENEIEKSVNNFLREKETDRYYWTKADNSEKDFEQFTKSFLTKIT
jgi:hypothetical protein